MTRASLDFYSFEKSSGFVRVCKTARTFPLIYDIFSYLLTNRNVTIRFSLKFYTRIDQKTIFFDFGVCRILLNRASIVIEFLTVCDCNSL